MNKKTKNLVLDWSTIVAVAGSKEAAKDIMDMYIKALPDFKKNIQVYYQAKKYDLLREEIHKLNGAAAFFSPELRRISYDSETALKEKELKSLPNLLKQIDLLIDQVIAAYK